MASTTLRLSKNRNLLMKKILGGWEVSAIFTAESGEPFTINGGNGNNNSGYDEGQDRADLVPGQPFKIRKGARVIGSTTTSTRQRSPKTNIGTPGNAPKFFLHSPPDRDMDVSFIKNFPFTSGIPRQFRWEMFNATNTPSYGSPDNNPTDSNFGQISGIVALCATRDPGRHEGQLLTAFPGHLLRPRGSVLNP